MFSILKRVHMSRVVGRTFATKDVTPQTRRKNLLVALVIFGFVGGVYYTAISKLKQTVSPFHVDTALQIVFLTKPLYHVFNFFLLSVSPGRIG